MAQHGSQTNGFPMAVVLEGGIALAAVALAWLFNVQLREMIPPIGAPMGQAVLRGLAVTVPMLAMFFWLVHSHRPAFRQLRQQVEWVIGEMFPTGSIGQFATVALLAGVGEELLFRGVIQNLVSRWTSPMFGLAIASLIFGAVHALSALYFVLATLIGAYFGWMAWYYNDLIAPIVAHSVYDFVALLYISRLRLSD